MRGRDQQTCPPEGLRGLVSTVINWVVSTLNSRGKAVP